MSAGRENEINTSDLNLNSSGLRLKAETELLYYTGNLEQWRGKKVTLPFQQLSLSASLILNDLQLAHFRS